MKKPRVMLINTWNTYEAAYGGLKVPMGLMWLAQGIRDLCDLQILDVNAEKMSAQDVRTAIRSFYPDIVGTTAWVNNWEGVKALGGLVRDELPPSHKYVVGGPYATIAPEIYLNHANADIVLTGEGIIPFRRLMEPQDECCLWYVPGIWYRSNLTDLVAEGFSDFRDSSALAEIEMPAYDLFPMEQYLADTPGGFKAKRCMTILSSWGCPFRCGFCTHNYLGCYHVRPIEHVRKEIRYLKAVHGVNFLYFADGTFTARRKRAENMCRMLQEEGNKWYAESRADCLRTKELVDKMAGSGCQTLWFGLETLSRCLLGEINKGITTGQIDNAVRWIREAGMDIAVYVIFNLPGQTQKDIDQVLRYLENNRLKAAPNVLFPLPGTPMWERMLEIGHKMTPLLLTQKISSNYYQQNRAYPVVNLSAVSDEKIKEAVNWVWQHNDTL